jgi:spore maturation protein CgeB
MRLFLLGKAGGVTHWLEDAAAAWSAEGHAVRMGIVRNPALHPAIEGLLLSEALGAPMAAGIARAIRGFAPDMILAIGGYHVPPVILERIAALPGRPALVGWVGDLFTSEAREAATLFDLVAYTDSGLIERHGKLGFPASTLYLPHAVNPHRPAADRARGPSMVFVANPTPHRRAVVAGLARPISLHGPAWSAVPRVDHHIHPRRVRPEALPGLYAAYRAALNIRNEHNVLSGLNQRNFDPCLAGTVVVTDHQADLERCFEPEREVLAWRDIDDLNGIHARLMADPAYAADIGQRGRWRVLADHTYSRRLEALVGMM